MRTCLHDCQHVVEYSTVMTLRGSRYAARPAVHSTHALACGVQAEKHAVHRSRGVRVMEAGAGVRGQAAGQVQGGVPAALAPALSEMRQLAGFELSRGGKNKETGLKRRI